jgi:hypothetical protein
MMYTTLVVWQLKGRLMINERPDGHVKEVAEVLMTALASWLVAAGVARGEIHSVGFEGGSDQHLTVSRCFNVRGKRHHDVTLYHLTSWTTESTIARCQCGITSCSRISRTPF